MFGIGMPEMLVLLAVALIVFGPKKLPELAKSMGRALGEFKKATSEIKENIEEQTGLGEVRDSLNEVQKDIKAQMDLGMADVPDSKERETASADAGDQPPLSQVKDAFDALNTEPPEDSPPKSSNQKNTDQTTDPDIDSQENSTP